MTALIGATPAPLLHVMSVNIRRRVAALRPADRWTTRAPALRSLLREESPTLVGVQEALPDQARAVRAALGERFRFVGHGRGAGGRGEGCPLFYDAARLELVAWTQQALSDTPQVAGSVSWGNLVPRVIVSAQLRDRETGVRFLAMNTHLDHLSRRARLRSARELRRLVASQPLPSILIGDLNAGRDSATVRELFQGGWLADAWEAASVHETPHWGTFAHYRPPTRGGERIDWIAVSRGPQVVRAAINDRRPGGVWPSDHLPVQAVLRLPDGGAA